MLTIEQFRQLWQLLAALICDDDIVREASDVCTDGIFAIMRFCEKILEEN